MDQDFLLEKYGRNGVQDFYIFLYFTHETAHCYQHGEPLLNEFMHALTWTQFLRRHELLRFQVNTVSGYCCNKEYEYIADLNILDRHLRAFFHDTEAGTSLFFGETSIYQSLLATAWLMEQHQIAYRDYLYVISTAFRKGEWDASLLSRILSEKEETILSGVHFVEKIALGTSA